MSNLAALEPLRTAKHKAAKKWWWWQLEAKSTAIRTVRRRKPYRYDPDRYYNTFLAIDSPPVTRPMQEEAPNIVWCAWTGDNELSPNRKAALESIRASNPASDVILVTPENVADFIIEGSPFHPIYEHLSLVHRSDYLRAYLMYHHGGAYTDLKRQRGSLTEAIELLNADPDRWLVAGPIPRFPAQLEGESALERECRIEFHVLPCGGAFALKAGSPLAHEWYAELHRRCDYFLEPARRNPGEVWGLWHPNIHNTRYPIHWNVLQANILEPLCLKYQEHLLLEDRFRPQLDNYR